jgi:hypothetical protein
MMVRPGVVAWEMGREDSCGFMQVPLLLAEALSVTTLVNVAEYLASADPPLLYIS